VVPSDLLPRRSELTPARRRLFETALGLFALHGYNGVSVRDIARELGQQPTAIYAHVDSKQQLLFEIVKIGLEELNDWMRKAVLEAGSDPLLQVRALVTAHVLVHLEHPSLAHVINAELGQLSREQTAVADVLIADSVNLLRDVVDRGITQGALHPIDLDIALRAIVVMGVHAATWWSPTSGTSAQHVAETHASLALRMLT
jgi:AcrR family transcriptional regulator